MRIVYPSFAFAGYETPEETRLCRFTGLHRNPTTARNTPSISSASSNVTTHEDLWSLSPAPLPPQMLVVWSFPSVMLALLATFAGPLSPSVAELSSARPPWSLESEASRARSGDATPCPPGPDPAEDQHARSGFPTTPIPLVDGRASSSGNHLPCPTSSHLLPTLAGAQPPCDPPGAKTHIGGATAWIH